MWFPVVAQAGSESKLGNPASNKAVNGDAYVRVVVGQ
jgi:hypothetical protein